MTDMFSDSGKSLSQREMYDVLTKLVSTNVGKKDKILSEVATNINLEKFFYYKFLFSKIGLSNTEISKYVLTILKIRGSVGMISQLNSMELLSLALANKEVDIKEVKNSKKEDNKGKIDIEF